ncbi:MAG: SHOCT domain-containing protein [Herbiconiux sp.]|nr:MAG: SHOCT domain-containing protein [Herbiconiux sp.]
MGRPGLLGLAARTAVVAGTASAVSGGMQRRQQQKSQEEQQQEAWAAQQQQAQIDAAAAAAVAAQTPAAPVAPPLVAPAQAGPAGGVDIIAELQKLAALKEQGILTDDEFTAAKAKLLA